MNSKKKMQQKFAKKFCRKVLNFFGIPIFWEFGISTTKKGGAFKSRECCAHCGSQCEGHLSIFNSNQEMDVVADHETPRKWKRLYGMHQWPPTMPTGRTPPDWRDWLMAPLIMSSINESWTPGRRSRRRMLF